MIVLRQHYNFQLHAELYSVADIMTGVGVVNLNIGSSW